LDRLDDKMKEAEQRLDTNKDEQQRAQEQMDECYKLALRHRNAGSAVLELKKSVQIAAAAFDVEYNKVTDAQTVENGLWDGLLGLKNYINQTDYRTTRDNSLRVILKLLDMDDEVFRGQQLYEDAEEAIKLAIKAKMGDDAVAKLSRETPGITDEQFQY
jgi:hypothetical protein